MARALLLALTCAAAASAARYVDYSGVKMPAYGAADYDAPPEPAAAAPSDDYRGHSADAPASPDYKYEEEPRVKTEKTAKDSDEPEVWRKPGRKQRGLIRPPIETAADAVHKYEHEEDDVPKFRSSHRYQKHRSRLKSELPSRDDEPPPRRAKYIRDRKDDVSDIDSKDYDHVDKDDFPDDKSKEFEEDVKFVNEATTRRGARRKPRDKFVKRKSDFDIPYDDVELNQRLKNIEADIARRPRPSDVREHASQTARAVERERFRPVLDEDDDELAKVDQIGKAKQKPYEDYDDYYDMKRVNSIKKKLPSLLRRTTERPLPPTPTSYLDMLWSNRRLMPPDEDATEHHDSTTVRIPSPRPKTPSTTTRSTTASTTKTAATKPAVTTTVIITTPNMTVLSLAEKSRLSILKKDQRKKGQHLDASTQKPPVLLQVTKYVPTVVMVEPPSSMHPWMRVRELSEDTPQRIEKVKKLMRRKLVAESKSLRELTDNWDELVCDYIDVALLDADPTSRAPRSPRAPAPLATCVVLVCVISHVYLFI